MVDLEPEGGHGDRLHVAGDLFGAFAGPGQDVHLFRPPDLVGDDARCVHRRHPTELLLDLRELVVVHRRTVQQAGGPANRLVLGLVSIVIA